MTVTLIVPTGTRGYPISHGTMSYEPYPGGAGHWLVDVPDHVAVHLLHVGGFVMPKREALAMSIGIVRMRHPEGIGCSFAGRNYEADAEGVVRVPAEAAADLAAHGFTPAPAKAGAGEP